MDWLVCSAEPVHSCLDLLVEGVLGSPVFESHGIRESWDVLCSSFSCLEPEFGFIAQTKNAIPDLKRYLLIIAFRNALRNHNQLRKGYAEALRVIRSHLAIGLWMVQ